jgi:outer membrane protein TolC
MIFKSTILSIVLLSSLNAKDKEIIELNIEKLVKEVLKRNSTISIENLQSKILQLKVDSEDGIFTPKFYANYTQTTSDTPNNTENTLSRSYLSTYGEKTISKQIGLTGLLPTGATWNASITSDSKSSTLIDKYKDYGKEHENSMQLSITQPLLKGFGQDFTLAKYRLAKADKQIYDSQFKKKLMDIIGSIIQSYWKYYGTQKLEQSWKKSLSLTQDDLEILEKRVKSGDVPYSEVLKAKSGLLSKKAEYAKVISRLDEIKSEIFSLLNVSSKDNSHIEFRLVEEPKNFNKKYLKLDDYYKMTMKNWPEFKVLEHKMQKEDLNIQNAKDSLKPQLDLIASFSSNTLDDSASYRYYDKRFQTWSVGVQFSTPLNKDKERSLLELSKVSKLQLKEELRSLYKALYNAVSVKLKAVKSSQEQLAFIKEGLTIKQDILKYERKALELGSKSIKEILDIENDIINYERKYYSSLMDWKISEATLKKAIGTLIYDFTTVSQVRSFEDKVYDKILTKDEFGKI